jgi:hypothetical protein
MLAGGIESAAIVAAAAFLSFYSQQQQMPVPHANKPFGTFEEFYPFYLKEHSDQTCKRLHFVGTSIVILMTWLNPGIITAMAASGFLGHAVSAAYHPTARLPAGAHYSASRYSSSPSFGIWSWAFWRES